MNMMLVSMADGSPEWERILDFTAERNARWASKNRVAFVKYSQIPSNLLTSTTSRRPASFYRLLLMEQLLQEQACSVIVWVDADAVIQDDLFPELIVPQPSGIVTVTDHNGVNCGLICLRNNAWSLGLLRRWWDEGEQDINHPWWENMTLKRLLKDPELASWWEGIPTGRALIHAAGVPAHMKLAWLRERVR